MESKEWWASRTMWTGIIMAMSGIFGALGIVVSEETQANLITLFSTFMLLVGGPLIMRLRATTSTKIGKPESTADNDNPEDRPL